MYKRILIPMESEEQQEPAVVQGRTLARQTGGTVILAWLVPVLSSGERFFTQIQVEPGSSGARRKARGEEFLDRAVEAFRNSGVDMVPRLMVTPQPVEDAIVELAAEEDADLIIMTTLPQSAVGRFLFGSVGEKVRRRATIPVLFVTATQTGEGGN